MISLKKCDFLDCSLQQTFGVVSTFCAVVKVIYIPSTTIDLVSFFYWAVLKIYALKSTFLGQNTSSIQSKLYIPSTWVHTINTDYDWNLQYLGCITLTVVCITAWRHNVWACEHLSCHHSRFLSSFILLYTTMPHQAEKVIICSIIFCEYYGRQLLKIFQEIFISVEKFSF